MHAAGGRSNIGLNLRYADSSAPLSGADEATLSDPVGAHRGSSTIPMECWVRGATPTPSITALREGPCFLAEHQVRREFAGNLSRIEPALVALVQLRPCIDEGLLLG